MSVLIKTRNFSLAGKREKDWNAPGSGGLGWNPDYVHKFEGVNWKTRRYDRNYSRMKGICTLCQHFEDVDTVDGSHCKNDGVCHRGAKDKKKAS